MADLKGHAVDHGFHVHDERHFVETYSLRQLWEVDLHPEEACNGPIDLHLSLGGRPTGAARFRGRGAQARRPRRTTRPPGSPSRCFSPGPCRRCPHPPDLLVLATELAGVGGIALPLEVSAIDSFASVTDAPERSLSMVTRIPSRPRRRLPCQREGVLRHPRPVQRSQPVPPRTSRHLARRCLSPEPRRRTRCESAN